jgi:DNA-binding MarR family transcriptional regulator
MVTQQFNYRPHTGYEEKPNLDEMVYNWIKLGYTSIEELVKLKNDFELDIQDVVETLKRLQKYELIKITKDEVKLNGVYDL